MGKGTRSWISSWKIELRLITRSRWTWIMLALGLAMVGIQFFSRMGTDDPGLALHSTAFIVAGGIFVSLVAGLALIRREQADAAEEVFGVLPAGPSSKAGGKVLALLTMVAAFLALSLCAVFALFAWREVPGVFYGRAAAYLLLYWAVPFVIAGLIGMAVGIWVKSRLVYLLFAAIWVLIGPLNLSLMEQVMVTFAVDLTAPLAVLNLGQTDPNAPYDPVYGLPMESRRWVQKGVWLLVAVCLLLLALKRRVAVLLVPVVLAIPLLVLYNQESQVVNTRYEADSVQRNDWLYYRDHGQPAFAADDSYRIAAYDIDLRTHRLLQADVTMDVVPERAVREIVFTLYHQLRVRDVTVQGKEAKFEQREDQVRVTFAETVAEGQVQNVRVSYAGISSPAFFANEQAVLLPAYFPWYPQEGSRQAMTLRGADLIHNGPDGLYGRVLKREVSYSLRYDGPQPMYTNLTGSGKAPNGLTVTAGPLTERMVGGTRVVMPDSFYRGAAQVPGFLRDQVAYRSEIERDLGLPEREAATQVFLLSVPRETVSDPDLEWHLGDHSIVSVTQMFNHGGLFADRFLIASSALNEAVRTPEYLAQTGEMRMLFQRAYLYGYGTRNGWYRANDRPPLKIVAEDDLRVKNKEGSENTRKLISYLDQHMHDRAAMQAFFRAWLAEMNGGTPLDWPRVLGLLEKR